MANYQKLNVTGDERVELHDKIGLTGAEISVNFLPAGAAVPFVHAHKQNEEVYIVLEGKGRMVIDGESVDLSANDYLRVSPAAKRQLFADSGAGIRYICIQTKAGSLEGYTSEDGIIG